MSEHNTGNFDVSRDCFPFNRTEVVTVRELVKAKQEDRKVPTKNLFVQQMEDTLMRWKPPVSSHVGTTMAVEGNHPFQCPTAAFTKDIDIQNDTFQSSKGSLINATFNNWWKERFPTGLDGFKKNALRVTEEEDDCFSFNFENDNESQREIVQPKGRTPYGFPEPMIYPKTSEKEREIIYRNEREIYQQYYGNPVPDDYLSFVHNSDTYSQRKSTCWLRNGLKSCFPLCEDM